MSKRNKLLKFSEILTFPNVLENFDGSKPILTLAPGQSVEFQGVWSKSFFKNEQPITLELACGRGEYSLALARNYPDRNFLGIDVKGARIWQGAKVALAEKLDNVGFIRTRIEQLPHFFAAGEIDEMWITFPDPFLKTRKSDRRLTSIPFLKRYQQFLKPGGLIHLKTDSPELFEFSLEMMEEAKDMVTVEAINKDIYAGELPIPELDYKTYYEGMHLAIGRKIKYLRFALK